VQQQLLHWHLWKDAARSGIGRATGIGVQAASGASCRSRLITATTTSLRQAGRDAWNFLEQTWIAHHRGRVMPVPRPDP